MEKSTRSGISEALQILLSVQGGDVLSATLSTDWTKYGLSPGLRTAMKDLSVKQNLQPEHDVLQLLIHPIKGITVFINSVPQPQLHARMFVERLGKEVLRAAEEKGWTREHRENGILLNNSLNSEEIDLLIRA